jgi:hypothetical protein
MANSQLIQGARDVAQAKQAGVGLTAKAATEVGAFIAQGVSTTVQRNNREFNRLMEAELKAAGDISGEEYNDLVKKLKRKRFGYVYLNKRGKAQAEKEVDDIADNLQKDKDARNEIIETVVDDTENLPPEVEDVITQTSDKKNQEIDDNGNIIYRVDLAKMRNKDGSNDPFLYNADGSPKYVNKNGKHRTPTYTEAWNDNEIFTTSADGKTKTSIKGDVFPNTAAGYKAYVAHSEGDYQKTASGKKPKSTDDLTTVEKMGDDPLRGILIPGGESGSEYFMSEEQVGLYNKPTNSPNKMIHPFKKVEEQNLSEELAKQEDNKKKSGTYMNIEQLKTLVDQYKIDRESQNKIRAVIEKEVSNAEAFIGGDTRKTFNRAAVKMNFMNNVLNSETANLTSIATHKHWGSTSWKQDISKALVLGSYEELGITRQQVKSNDPTPKTAITTEDINVIVDSIMKNEELLKETLAEYYTSYAEKNYNAIAAGGKADPLNDVKEFA